MNEASFQTMQQQADELLADHRLRNIVYAWFGIYKIQTQILERNIERTEALINTLKQN